MLPVLDVVIGLTFIYLIVALVCTAVTEMYAGGLDRREKNLNAGIANLLGEHACDNTNRRTTVPFNNPVNSAQNLFDSAVTAFYLHPMIKALHEDGTRPSYIPSETFSKVIFDLFAPTDGTSRSKETFVAGIKNALPDGSDLRRTLLTLSAEAADMTQLKSSLESWFNNSMDRVSAWYKNKSQLSVLVIALIICFFMNADTIQIVKDLYNNPTERNSLVTQAQQAVKNVTIATPAGKRETVDNEAKSALDALGKLNSSGITWGWGNEYYLSFAKWNWDNVFEALFKTCGIVFTAIAASLGAPFWFDTLNKLINLRAVNKSPEEKSASTSSA